MTNTPRSDAEQPTDPAVRQLLWRLRARLVSPPDADRAASDLDRIFSTARDHAHVDPASQVDGEVAAGVEAAGSDDTAATAPGVAAPIRLTSVPAATSAQEPPARRRQVVPQHLGRIAAALVLVAAVGGGVAGARDGQLSLHALLGTVPAVDGEAPVVAADPMSTDPDAAAADADDQAIDAGVAGPFPDLDATDPADGVPDVDLELTPPPAEPEEEAEGSSGSSRGEPSGAADDGSTGSSGTSGSANGTGRGSAGASDGSAGARGGASSDGSSGSDSGSGGDDDTLTEEVIAAPPSRNLDGFGGPQPCPEDKDLAACLEERQAEQDADGGQDADGSEQADKDADRDDGGAGSDDGVTSEKDKLAQRRGSS